MRRRYYELARVRGTIHSSYRTCLPRITAHASRIDTRTPIQFVW